MASGTVQYPLSLSFRPARGRDDFLVGPCNEEAVAWVDLYPDWPQPLAVLTGGPGSGKTHLLSVWGEKSGALWLEGASLSTDGLDKTLGTCTVVALDGADNVPDPVSLFHLINMMRERSGTLVLASRVLPARWSAGPADLHSRLRAGLQLSLGEADEDFLSAVLMKHFDDRQLKVGPEVLNYLKVRLPRTFDAVRRIADEIDRLSLAEKRSITIHLAKRALVQSGLAEED